jgi:uncharacterized damage-inducible protein DinB
MVVPADEWEDSEALAFWDPEKYEITMKRQPRTLLMHTFWHECMHAMLDTLSHPLATDEVFVDQMGGLIAQIMNSAEY